MQFLSKRSDGSCQRKNAVRSTAAPANTWAHTEAVDAGGLFRGWLVAIYVVLLCTLVCSRVERRNQ